MWVKKVKLNYCGIMNIQCDHVINATIDMIMWLSTNRRESAPLSILLYQGIRELFKQKIPRMWNTKTVQEIKVVVGSFASVTKNLENWLESWT